MDSLFSSFSLKYLKHQGTSTLIVGLPWVCYFKHEHSEGQDGVVQAVGDSVAGHPHLGPPGPEQGLTRDTSHVTRDPAPEEAALLTVGVRVPARVPTQRPPAVPAHEAARHLPAEKLVSSENILCQRQRCV